MSFKILHLFFTGIRCDNPHSNFISRTYTIYVDSFFRGVHTSSTTPSNVYFTWHRFASTTTSHPLMKLTQHTNPAQNNGMASLTSIPVLILTLCSNH